MTVWWSRHAERDLLHIEKYLSLHSESVACRVVAHIITTADGLRTLPRSGRTGTVKGTREKLTLPFPYVLIYEHHPRRGEIFIVRVYHMAQNR